VVFTGAADPGQPGALWIADAAGGEAPRRLTEPTLGDDLHPRFSPDGRRVAFFRGRDARRQPWTVAADGSGARALTDLAGAAHGLAWLGPAGPLLVASDWSGAGGLHVLDAASGALRAAGGAGARFPDVSPAGDVVFERVAAATPRNGLGPAAETRPAATSPAPVELMMARAAR
jgi:dipeptidyl aminopeptidase/acylaminoacyl peptidase